MSKAVNPLMGTIGGVVGPVATFFALCYVFPLSSLAEGLDSDQFPTGIESGMEMILNGWGIPTATDIALAWLVARLVFGASHPAVSYLLLLAVADDAIGLGIIAIFYPDPAYPVEPLWLVLTIGGMISAFVLRRCNVHNLWLYILICGGMSWTGLISAHLHPALALVFIIPFLPSELKDGQDRETSGNTEDHHHSTLIEFEHKFKTVVDFGLFFFGLANAGVQFSGINSVTWIILLSLVIGKTLGIGILGYGCHLIGPKLPEGMNLRSLIITGIIAGLGLTVALFVSGEAYAAFDDLKGAAKMGALLSVVAAPIAIILGIVFKIKKMN